MRHGQAKHLMADHPAPVSVVNVLQKACKFQFAVRIPNGLELPQLLEGLHIPVPYL